MMTSAPQTLTCEISNRVFVTDNIFILTLRASSPQRFEYQPGQYAVLSIKNDNEHAPRPYSIAVMPGQDTLVFHIKDNGHGLSHALATADTGQTLEVEYPMGSAVYTPSDRPIIAVGGGLGLAPLLPIVKTALSQNSAREIHLYHGAADQDNLYQDMFLKSMAENHSHFHYIPVIEHLHGTAAMAAAERHDDLSGFDAYLSGAPVMVMETFKALQELGLRRQNTYSDGLSNEIKDFV